MKCDLCKREPKDINANPVFGVQMLAPENTTVVHVCYACLDQVSPAVIFDLAMTV